ncbi:signal peptidase I [Microbacterium betulae]|uniref:Signal peptidase I n=1 Tax=Microbacterium betulae TaxID=2981139 RepID=A0AA97FJ89_9MICO|nr:signal peptidase I [Microbacterium sp. AB]WOF23719.1 signal peptidase I [Microbacterium sp. AB]
MTQTTAPEAPRTRRDARVPGTRTGRGPAGVVGDALLTLAAIAGAACIVLVLLAHLLDVSLILFRTGSMEPTIPTGSVAVVQRVAADELSVGDVVTVDREGLLPITHRITSVEGSESADERVITMRGDANEQDDPHPYAVSSARIVLFSVPALAPVIASLGDPLVLGGLTVGATVLVMWAFWPRGSVRGARRGRTGRRG